MTTPFDRLFDTAKPHLPGAMDTAIKQELFHVFRDFLTRSMAWREDIQFTLQASTKTADLYTTAGKLDQLISVANPDGFPVVGAYMLDSCQIKMPYEHTTDQTYVATVAVTVTDPTTRDSLPIVPYPLVEKYMETILHGLYYRMMVQPSKPYTNAVLAPQYERKFIGGSSRARNETNRGSTVGSQVWAYPQQFRTVR